MKYTKRIFSIFLTALLLFSLFSVTAFADGTIKITLDLNGGDGLVFSDPSKQQDTYKQEGGYFVGIIESGKPIKELPTPIRNMYSFVRWEDESGNSVSTSTIFNRDTRLKAIWEPIQKPTEEKEVYLYFDPLDATYFSLKNTGYIFFDENGYFRQSGKYWVAKITPPHISGDLPVATKEGYTFKGWQTANGTMVDRNSSFTKDEYLTPVFELEDPNNRRVYSVRVELATNTHVTVYGSQFNSGDEVYVLVTPPDGYEGNFEIHGEDQTAFLKVDKYYNEDVGLWCFKMPAADIVLVPTEYMAHETRPKEHSATLNYTGSGMALLDRGSAYEGESVGINIIFYEGSRITNMSAITTSGRVVQIFFRSASEYYFNMPNEDVVVTVNFLDTGSTTPTDPETVEPYVPGSGSSPGTPTDPYEGYYNDPDFSDIPTNAWYYDSVRYMYEEGIMEGIGDGLFGPNVNTTRAMVVTVLYRMVGSPSISYNLTFQDISTDGYYYNALQWATKNKIVKGYSDTRFAPDDVITREQLVAVLYRFAISRGLATPTYEYSTLFKSAVDLYKISDYAIEPMNWAITNNIIYGTTQNYLTIDPTGNTTRAQIATIFHRWMKGLDPYLLKNLKTNEMIY